MKLGFEKQEQKSPEDLHEEYQKDPHEKGSLEVDKKGSLHVVDPESRRAPITSDNFIDYLNSEIKEKIDIRILGKLLDSLGYPEKFKEKFEQNALLRNSKENLKMIDTDIQALSHVYDVLQALDEEVLEQRLTYKDISDVALNTEVKKRLDDRIAEIKKFEKNAIDLLDYSYLERVKYILQGENEGTLREEEDDDKID